MPGKEKKWSFRSIFSRSKSKNAGQDSGINGTSVQKQQTPPSYTNIAFEYKKLLTDAETLGNAEVKHNKKDDLEKLHKRKSDLNQKYAEAISVSGANEDTVQSWQRENMASAKQSAEIVVETTDKKLSKNIEARESLEKHKDSALVKVVQYATKVKKKDEVMEEDLFAPIQSGLTKKERKVEEDKRRALAAKKEKLAEERKEAEAKSAKKESRDSKMEKAGFLSTMGGFLGTVFGSIADSVETLADAGVETKSSLDALKQGKKGRLEFLKDNSTSWTGGLGIAAAGLSLISGIVSMVELGRGLVQAIKHNRKKNVDAQEKWLDARTALGNICETVSNLIGAVAPFTSMVPFLGSSLAIADSGLQIVVGSMNLATNSVHAVKMRHDKEKLWKEIERKRKKYADAGSIDASYFDVDSVEGKSISSQNGKRKQKFSSIDQKRRGLLKTVAEAQGIEKIELNEKSSKNASEFAGAEMEISTKLSAMRRDWHEGKSGMTREDYKKSMHQMEALQLMSQYRTAEKAAKKMHKAIGHDVEGLATNGTKIVGNALSLAGQITAASGFGATLIAAGVGVNLAEGAYEQGRTAGSFLYKQFRKFSGAEANKQNTRAEMGAYLYDKMLSLGPDYVEWDGNFFKLDNSVPDYRVREESKSMNELYSIVRRGLDARVSTLLGATTADDMKGALAEAFGQED